MSRSEPGNIALNVAGYTLIVPALGLGNICQLAIDAILNTLIAGASAAQHIGHIQTKHAVPVVGSNPFESSPGSGLGSVLNMEMYAIPAAKVVFLQQRAPALDLHHELLIQDIHRWAQTAGIAKVFVLSAADAILRPERMARNDRLAFVSVEDSDAALTSIGAHKYDPNELSSSSSGGMGKDDDSMRSAAVSALVRAPPDVPSYFTGGGSLADLGKTSDSTAATHKDFEELHPDASKRTAELFASLWGTGYAPVYYRRFLSSALTGRQLPLSCLFYFTNEGDNLADAILLAKGVIKLMGLEELIASAFNNRQLCVKANPDKKAKKALRALERDGFVLPAYFPDLFGAPIDIAAGSYGV